MKRAKGIHDITTSLYNTKAERKREIARIRRLSVSPRDLSCGKKRVGQRAQEIADSPRIWAFSTRPKFRRYQKPISRNLSIERVEEPKTDVFEKTDNLVIMAELTGVKHEDIHWEIHGDIFTLYAQNKFTSRKYIKEILLPFVVEEVHIDTSYRNCIFEICFWRKKGKGKGNGNGNGQNHSYCR